jgi:hypothetical protein
MKLKRKMISFFYFFPSNGATVEWNWQVKTEVLREKPVPVPLCPPQIPHGLTQDRTPASAVGGRRLTAWAMAATPLTFKLAVRLYPCRLCPLVNTRSYPFVVGRSAFIFKVRWRNCSPSKCWWPFIIRCSITSKTLNIAKDLNLQDHLSYSRHRIL